MAAKILQRNSMYLGLIVEKLVVKKREREFVVFELDFKSETWTKVKDLGNRAIFLGLNSSFSIEMLDSSICKRNCIYFTNDSDQIQIGLFTDKWNMGIYDIGRGSSVPHLPKYCKEI